MTSGLHIRSLTKEELPAVAEISAAIPLFQRYGNNRENALARLTADWQEGQKKLYVAEMSGDVVGFISFIEKGAFGLSGYVQQIFVAPEVAGQGVGKALLEFIEREHGGPRGIMLLVNAENESAIGFYHKLGYRQVGRVDGYLRPDLDELIFYKPQN